MGRERAMAGRTGQEERGIEGDRGLRTAIVLMRMALALLDRGRRPLAAARLQHAIDTALGSAPGPPAPEQLDAFEGRRS